MNSSRFAEIERFAVALARGAGMELYLTPKPGLVDLTDCGSHPDLSLSRMERSLLLLADYLGELVRSLIAGESFAHQAAIGLRTEKNMLATLGTNTHKGFLFLSGLLLVARWRCLTSGERHIRAKIASLACEFFGEQQEETNTHGRQARARYGTGGIVREAKNGFPSLFDEAVPAYLEAFDRYGCCKTASFAMLGRLMQTVEDTTTLHRCGTLGLARIKRDGRFIERIIAAGGDCVPFLQAINREYIRINLTMGGVADMLGLSFGYLAASGVIGEDSFHPIALISFCQFAGFTANVVPLAQAPNIG
ncbi:MAG TPA: triphosphoribosyl-dephospho-CoA synthase [Geobacteraceae bacterium]|nr:triphosphoribosyl-dephospho-CoA synthase [Geobacteraceae bacterium]